MNFPEKIPDEEMEIFLKECELAGYQVDRDRFTTGKAVPVRLIGEQKLIPLERSGRGTKPYKKTGDYLPKMKVRARYVYRNGMWAREEQQSGFGVS